jgi:GntR family transcriptional regulator/MocR family aminotransferase
MGKQAQRMPALPLALNRQSSQPFRQQLYEALRNAILSGQLPAGAKLPSTRTLAADLRIARMTVVHAFGQLYAEGYVEGRIGAGTYVAALYSNDPLATTAQRAPAQVALPARTLSRRGAALVATRELSRLPPAGAPQAFRPSIPAIDAFPFELWERLTIQRYRSLPRTLLNYGEPAGYRPLRRAVSDYLRMARGVRCDEEQVIITAGSQQALDLIVRVLLDPGDVAWVEDPGYTGVRAILAGAGMQIAPVPVDAEGLDIAAAQQRQPAARLVYVTPSHQYPLGITMSLPRRLALIEWAHRQGAWIVEDDYDSEFRYAGRPLPALQGLDTHNHTIYVGTWSKMLFPALRLGYIVAPPDLVDALVAARTAIDLHPPVLEQAVLADFLHGGHLAQHLRRMRTLYAERQDALLRASGELLGDWLDVIPRAAGLNVLGWLRAEVSDSKVSQAAAALGIDAPPLSFYTLAETQRPALVLGYAAIPAPAIREGVVRLGAALRNAMRDA